MARIGQASALQAAVHRMCLPAAAGAAGLPAGQRVQDVHRVRRRRRLHPRLRRADLRHTARTGDRLKHQDQVRAPRRQGGPDQAARAEQHRRQARQAYQHQPAHRPPADSGIRQFRWRPADARIHDFRLGSTPGLDSPPRRRRARIRLRSRLESRPPGQGTRRGAETRVDRGFDEEGLQGRVPAGAEAE